MRLFLALLTIYVVMAAPVWAQGDPFVVRTPTRPLAEGVVGLSPSCFDLINRAPYSVTGHIATNYFTNENGIRTRHRSNFRLATGEVFKVCSSGPFFDGNKLELVLRTLFPIFDCKTAVNGDVVVYGRHKPEGGTETWAECNP